jgi:hypothetical protein
MDTYELKPAKKEIVKKKDHFYRNIYIAVLIANMAIVAIIALISWGNVQWGGFVAFTPLWVILIYNILEDRDEEDDD